MFIKDNQLQCSKCGSRRYETFSSETESGIRCLNCGREVVTKKKTAWHLDVHDDHESISWHKSNDSREF